MKICITSSGDSLKSEIDPRFGRCKYFIIWDGDKQSFEAVSNPNVDAGSGVGIQSAQLVVTKNIGLLITGEVGPKAEKVLNAANVQIITGAEGLVNAAITKYLPARDKESVGIDRINNELRQDTPARDFSDRAWVGGRGPGRCIQSGMGKGQGRGMGQGRGLGLGRGRGGGGRNKNNV